MRIPVLGILGWWLLAGAAHAQIPAALRELPAPTRLTETHLVASPTFGGTVCGADSSIYFRRQARLGPPLAVPVTKLNADGTVTELDLGALPDLGGQVAVLTFSVDKQSGIYAIVQEDRTPFPQYLVTYDAQGRYQSKALLEGRVVPGVLLRLPDGHFLISGRAVRRKDESPSSVTGIFDGSGKETTSLKLGSDDSEVITSPQGVPWNPAVENGAARSGDDGYSYLFKAGAHAKVQVLDAGGHSARIMEISPPVANSEPFDFFVDGARLAILFQQKLPDQEGRKPVQMILALYSTKTGELLTSYVEKTPVWSACMKDGILTTLVPTSDKQHYAIGKITLP